jgi:hypothetical protein
VTSAPNTRKRKSGDGGPAFQKKAGKMHFCNVVRYFFNPFSVPRTRNAIVRRHYETLHRDKFDVESKPREDKLKNLACDLHRQ